MQGRQTIQALGKTGCEASRIQAVDEPSLHNNTWICLPTSPSPSPSSPPSLPPSLPASLHSSETSSSTEVKSLDVQTIFVCMKTEEPIPGMPSHPFTCKEILSKRLNYVKKGVQCYVRTSVIQDSRGDWEHVTAAKVPLCTSFPTISLMQRLFGNVEAVLSAAHPKAMRHTGMLYKLFCCTPFHIFFISYSLYLPYL